MRLARRSGCLSFSVNTKHKKNTEYALGCIKRTNTKISYIGSSMSVQASAGSYTEVRKAGLQFKFSGLKAKM